MEKRKVRIYKSHDGEGKYINKTKQFLEKAQGGMEVSGSQDDVQEQLENVKLYIKGLKSEDIDDQDIYKVLVSKGIRKDIASYLLEEINSEIEEEEAAAEQKENGVTEEGTEPQQEMSQEEVPVEEESDQGLDYYNSYADEEEDYNPNMEYQYGGKTSKKNFTKNVLSLLKKQEGGAEKEPGKGERFDTINGDVSKKSEFVSKIKEIADKAAVDELYKKMMGSNNPELIQGAQKIAEQRNKPPTGTFQEAQSGGLVGGDKQPEMFMYGGTDIPFYEADMLPEAKRGIISSKAYNAKTKEEYKDSFEGLNPYAKTVHKRGLLGRPKQWTEYYSKGSGSSKPLTSGQEIKAAYEKQMAEDKSLKHGVEKDVWDTLPGKAKREIRRGERQLGREARRGADSMKEDAAFNKGVHAEYKYENPEDLARDQKRSDDAWDKDKSFVSDIDYEGVPYKDIITKKRDLGNGEYRWDPVNIFDKVYGPAYSDLDKAELPTVVDKFKYKDLITPIDFENASVMNERDQADSELIKNSGSMKDFLKFHGNKMQNILDTEEEYGADELEEPMLPQTFQFKPGKSKAQEFENLQEYIENKEQSDFKNQKNAFRYGGLPKAQTGPPVKKPSDPTTNTGDLSGMLKPASNPNSFMGATQSFPGAPSAPVNPDAGKVKTVQMDPNQTKGQTITSEDFGDPKNDDIIAVDKQRAPSNFDGEDAVNKFNVGATAVTGFLNNLDSAKQQKEMYDNNFTSDNMYAASNSKDRGDYVDYGQQVGQFRYDQMGSDTSGRFAYGQEGGYMQKGGNTKKEILKEFTDTPEFKRGLELMMQRENTDNVDPFLNAMEEADYSEEDKTKYREAIGAMNDSEWLKIVPQKSAYTKTNRHRELQDLMNKAYGLERYNTPYAVGSGGPRRNDPSYYPMDERRPTPFEDGRIDPRTLEAIQPGPNEYEGMQTGGYMQEGGFTEGDEVDMTEEELEEFLANGGEVEYL
jgi:hypothetical protein